MKKPVLVIMAAGMGSRYGGLKQIDPVDQEGHIIMDFSIYDAKKAGFEKVVFIIKKENERDFKEAVGRRIEKVMETAYVYQELDRIPEGFDIPEGRVKPWGTAHAILCAAGEIDSPFAVINADDYYGRSAFDKIYQYLTAHEDDEKYRYTMVGYRLKNTVTDNGHVARGICELDENKQLVAINERTRIEKRDGGIAYSEDDGETWVSVDPDTLVSMNMWGFTPGFTPALERDFRRFFQEDVPGNPLKAEFFLPFVVNDLLAQDKAQVTVLSSEDKWYGVTYHQDKERVVSAIQTMTQEGKYPAPLWN